MYFSGPKFYFTKFLLLLQKDIWQHMLKIRKVIVMGLQKVVFDSANPAGLGKGMIDWLGKVRSGKSYL